MKNLSIKIKVLIILLLMTVAMIVAMAISMQIGFDKGFFNYRKALNTQFQNNLIKSLENYYQEHENWQDFASDRTLWHEIINQSTIEMGRHPSDRPTPNRDRPKRRMDSIELNQKNRPENPPRNKTGRTKNKGPQGDSYRSRLLPPVVLFSTEKKFIVGLRENDIEKLDYKKILFNDEIVGYLGVLKNNKHNQKQDDLFKNNIQSMLIKLAIIMLAFAILMALPIAKYFTTLINKLTVATQKIAKGDYSIRIKSNRKDELGLLANHLNILAQSLESSAQSQKTVMADIAHELRTPIAVIIGEIEAIQDGVHPVDVNTLNLLHSQVSSLVNLVDDLRELSESDLGSLRYKIENFDLSELLQQCYQNYQMAFTQKEILLEVFTPNSPCILLGDINRLKQLFSNILDNSVHYTNSGGQTKMTLKCEKDWVTVCIQDSAPGLKSEQLEKIFERWYRAEKSRNRDSGGTGLGLAIGKEIVKAHNGTIKAEKSSLGGIEIIIKLPRNNVHVNS